MWRKKLPSTTGEILFSDNQYINWDTSSRYTALRWTTAHTLSEVVAKTVLEWGEPSEESLATFELVTTKRTLLPAVEALQIARVHEQSEMRVNFNNLDAAFVWGEKTGPRRIPDGYTELGVLFTRPTPMFIEQLCRVTTEPNVQEEIPFVIKQIRK